MLFSNGSKQKKVKKRKKTKRKQNQGPRNETNKKVFLTLIQTNTSIISRNEIEKTKSR
jgi:hypothetical protein